MSLLDKLLEYPKGAPTSYPAFDNYPRKNKFDRNQPSSVDWDFISKLEGGQQLNAYVPYASGSKSGVTIATGFDLGQRTVAGLKLLKLSQSLIDKLEPFLGFTSLEAVERLETARKSGEMLKISATEADQIDAASKRHELGLLRKRYKRDTHKNFADLPSNIQTVIASVAFQYGYLRYKTPKFWRYVMDANWWGLREELRNFGDDYNPRRQQEAKLLDDVLEGTVSIPYRP